MVTPFGSEDEEIASTGTTTMLRAFVAVSAGTLESVALTVKLDVPAVVGVPVMLPLAANANPAGSAPAVIDQVIGAVPPVDCSAALYVELTIPFGSVVVVMLIVAAVIVMLRLAVAVRFAASFTCTVKLDVPAVVGVPEIVFPLRVKPAGRVPAVMLQL